MTTAVTGAAGFIGSNVAHALAASADLILVDHPLTPLKAANLCGHRRFTYLDHTDFLAALHRGAVRPTAVYHLGACSSTTETRWDYLQANNIDYTRTLWEWCAANHVPFVYASSAATYGDGSKGFSDRTPPAELTPLNLYGKSKNDFDQWALAEVAAGRPAPPAWAGVKFFNVYGPREPHKGRMASVVFQTWKQIRATGGMRLFRSTDSRYPDGGQLRDFVCVNDCVAHLTWLAAGRVPSGLYNSGTGTPRTFLDLATAVFAALGREPNIAFIDMPPDLARQYQNSTRADMTRLAAAGYPGTPTGLEDGVTQTVQWLEANFAP